MYYAYRIPNMKPNTYLVTDELFTSNVAKLRCEYAEDNKEHLLYLIRDYPTLIKKKSSDEYKRLRTLIVWTPARMKSGKIITPETREEYLV